MVRPPSPLSGWDVSGNEGSGSFFFWPPIDPGRKSIRVIGRTLWEAAGPRSNCRNDNSTSERFRISFRGISTVAVSAHRKVPGQFKIPYTTPVDASGGVGLVGRPTRGAFLIG